MSAGGVPSREGIGSAANKHPLLKGGDILVLSTWRRTGFKWSTGGCGKFHKSESIVGERTADVEMGARDSIWGKTSAPFPAGRRRSPKGYGERKFGK